MRSHSTKNQLKEKSLHAWIILSNTLHALFSLHFQKFSFQFRQFQSRGHSALGTLLAASLACPKLHTCTWRDPGVGGALARLRRRVLRRPAPRNGRQGGERRRNAVRRRPNPLVAPRGRLRASARMRHRRRGLARAERALFHRQAVRLFRRGQAVNLPPVLSWTLKWHHYST